jgi:molecular chaperone GrpE (heat shock protein)
VRAATKMYQGMQKTIDQLSKIFSKYEIDGLIVYKD